MKNHVMIWERIFRWIDNIVNQSNTYTFTKGVFAAILLWIMNRKMAGWKAAWHLLPICRRMLFWGRLSLPFLEIPRFVLRTTVGLLNTQNVWSGCRRRGSSSVYMGETFKSNIILMMRWKLQAISALWNTVNEKFCNRRCSNTKRYVIKMQAGELFWYKQSFVICADM